MISWDECIAEEKRIVYNDKLLDLEREIERAVTGEVLEKIEELIALRLTGPIKRPPVVCLCGSTRFMDFFFEAGWRFTLGGWIVLSVGVCKHADDHGAEALGPEVVEKLDTLHFRKIDMADMVFILNVEGYIGESTSNEIEYAEKTDKPVVYLESCEHGLPTEEEIEKWREHYE